MGKQATYRIDATVVPDGNGWIVKGFRASPLRGQTISISVRVQEQDKTPAVRDFIANMLANESLKVDCF